MKKLNWNSVGTGSENLILIHGWGLNSKIWNVLIQQSNLKKQFKLHLIDLPGFGKSDKLSPITLNNITQLISSYIPNNSIILGWSMGGLIASNIGLKYPNKIKGIISVSSSPCFIERSNWPGISKETFLTFYNCLKKNFQKTISDFILIQALNSNYSTIKNIQKDILSQPNPTIYTLKKSLEIIFISDLRTQIKNLKVPMLRIYGSLDTFVPKKVCTILDKLWPKTLSTIIEQSAHIPFVSHTQKFCAIILNFKKYLNTKT